MDDDMVFDEISIKVTGASSTARQTLSLYD